LKAVVGELRLSQKKVPEKLQRHSIAFDENGVLQERK